MIHDLCREIGYYAGLAAEEYYDRELSDERETYQRLAPLGPWFIDCARTRMAWLECETTTCSGALPKRGG